MRKIIFCVLYAALAALFLNPCAPDADQSPKTVTFLKSTKIELTPTSTMTLLLRGHAYYKQQTIQETTQKNCPENHPENFGYGASKFKDYNRRIG